VPRLYPGSTIVCLGTGPSLTLADVAAVRGRARVIAISDAYRLAPWAEVLYSCDGKWWAWHKGARDFAGLKFGMTIPKGQYPDVARVRNDGVSGLCLEPDGVRTGRNSGYQAINLAVHLGAARVLLLGYDMSLDGKRKHFFGDHPRAGLPSPYPSFLKLFPTLLEPLRACGVDVINCTRRTALATFPRRSLEAALEAVGASAFSTSDEGAKPEGIEARC
jgi:hypothetical protein